MNVDAVVAQLTAEIVESINARGVFLESIAEVAILTIISMHDQVAILRESGVVDVLGIHNSPLYKKILGRYCLPELLHLREDRSREIYIPTIGAWIPPVTVPTFSAVDGFPVLRRMLGK